MNKVRLTDNHPSPLPSDPTWLKQFNSAISPDTQRDHASLKTLMETKYCSGVGKLIWAMTTCRPDIAFASMKLSQSKSNPAKLHYHGLKRAIKYLYMTQTDGIFWRTRPHDDLPEGPLPVINSNERDLFLNDHPIHEATVVVAYGNSTWATCIKTRHSFSGICI
jgi:hypothetical protein